MPSRRCFTVWKDAFGARAGTLVSSEMQFFRATGRLLALLQPLRLCAQQPAPPGTDFSEVVARLEQSILQTLQQFDVTGCFRSAQKTGGRTHEAPLRLPTAVVMRVGPGARSIR
jgi:hypothetical protein